MVLFEFRVELGKFPFALKSLCTAEKDRRQGSAMNSLRSALTAVLSG